MCHGAHTCATPVSFSCHPDNTPVICSAQPGGSCWIAALADAIALSTNVAPSPPSRHNAAAPVYRDASRPRATTQARPHAAPRCRSRHDAGLAARSPTAPVAAARDTAPRRFVVPRQGIADNARPTPGRDGNRAGYRPGALPPAGSGRGRMRPPARTPGATPAPGGPSIWSARRPRAANGRKAPRAARNRPPLAGNPTRGRQSQGASWPRQWTARDSGGRAPRPRKMPIGHARGHMCAIGGRG